MAYRPAHGGKSEAGSPFAAQQLNDQAAFAAAEAAHSDFVANSFAGPPATPPDAIDAANGESGFTQAGATRP